MIFRSPFPQPEIPDVSLAEYVIGEAASRGDKPALVDGPSGRTITYAQLAGTVRAAAGGLADSGFGKGDVLGLLSPNLPEFAVAFFAAVSIGGVVTTINSLATADDIGKQLAHSGAKLLVTVPPFLDRALPGAKQAGIGEEVFVFGEGDGAKPFAPLMTSTAQPPAIDVDPESLVALPYSSGTTGLAKGVMLTHRNLVANVEQVKPVLGVGQDDVLIGVLPFFHIYGMTVIMNLGLHRGATIVTMPRFDLEQFLGLLQDHRVTRAYLVPPIVLALAKHPMVDRFDLSSLRVIFSGAAPLDAALADAAGKRLGCVVAQGYGLTETSPVTHATPNEPSAVRAGSVGPPVPGTDCAIVNWATGEQLGPNEDGEVLVRGPQVMKGYLDEPDATARTIDEDGWLHTGDIGHADEDGYLFVVDRLKELIKYKGYQVAPAELEAVLLSHPAVADVAVIPSPDEEAGEVPKAFVVLKPEAQATSEELMSFVGERVAPYKKIRAVEVIDEIPKSLSGKILRRVLVERERSRVSGS